MMSVIEQCRCLRITGKSHTPLTSNGVYLSGPQGKDVCVWSLADLDCKPLHLCGHRKDITALCFNHSCQPSTILCSAAGDYVIVWNIEIARQHAELGEQIRGKVIGKLLGRVECVCFGPGDAEVAVCAGKDVHILNAEKEEVQIVLEGHDALVTCAAFCQHYSSTLVTASEDRTFKIWDLSSSCMLYQSTIISSSPFISIAMNPNHPSFVLGTADGMLRIYDLTDGNNFRLLHSVDVAKVLRNADKECNKEPESETKGPIKISSKPSWQNPNSMPASNEVLTEDSEAGYSILGVAYQSKPIKEKVDHHQRPVFLNQDETVVEELLDDPPLLLVGTNGALVALNAVTMDFISLTSLQDPIPIHQSRGRSHVVSLASSMTFACSKKDYSLMWCAIVNLLCNEINVLRITCEEDNPETASGGSLKALSDLSIDTSDHAASSNSDEISVLSSAPLLLNSPLKSQFSLKVKETDKATKVPKGQPSVAGGLNKNGKILDKQPVTFKTKIKSSGYTQAPRKTPMFQPQTSFKPKKAPDTKSTKSSVVREYPMECDAPSVLKTKLDVDEKPTAINSVAFSPDGQKLVCSMVNSSAQILKMPLSGKGTAFVGHNGSVSMSAWSHSGQYLLTSCEDKTSQLWSLGCSDPLMTFRTVNSNIVVDRESNHPGSKCDKSNPVFPKAVRFAQFYYVDQFILLTCGNAIHLYKYHLDSAKSDIKRYQNNNKYKLVKSFELSEAQSISAFSAINAFHSYLALCAGSDKTLEVFDLNVGKSVRVMDSVHSKAAHTICQNEGSAFAGQSSSAYDLFATAAATDCIKLWDLRSKRCVRRYEGHMNRAHPCGLSISPCGRFLATGSEDRSAYIFDIRSSTYLHKLSGHTDVVSDVSFHPLYSQLVTATLDGKLRLFCDK